MLIQSPVSVKANVKLIKEYSKQEIIDLYRSQRIDVSRFFISTDTISLYECMDTNYRFFYPQFIFGDNEFYQDLYSKIPGYYHSNRWEHEQALKMLPKNCTLLEVGCGDGYFLEASKERCLTSEGIELNTKAVDKARAKGLQVSELTIQNFTESNKKKFDVVCCFQVLEHIYDVHSFITSMLQCLSHQGMLIIAVPNNNPYLFKHDQDHFLNLPPHHAGLWNIQSLTNLEKFYPIKVSKIMYEPLVELKLWYKAQVRHYKKSNSMKGILMGYIPRQVYKPILRLLRKSIQGKTIMVVYNVNKNEV